MNALLEQTIQNFEVVVVNDGSTDTTQDILEEYQTKSEIFKVYYQNNCGVAAARKLLVKMASGTHLLFCDADDYFEKNTIEEVSKTLEENDVDLLIYGYRLVRKTGTKGVLKRQLSEGTYTKSDWAHLHVSGLSDLYWSVLWNKCFKKEIVEKSPALKFQNNMEDVIFNVEYMGRCTSVYILEKELYNYVQMGESLTRGKKVDSEQKVKDAFETFTYLNYTLKTVYPNTPHEINRYMYVMLEGLRDRAKRLENKDTYLEIKNSMMLNQAKKELGSERYKIALKRRIAKFKNMIRTLIIQ